MSIKDKQIKTISGKSIKRGLTRRMKPGEYYEIGKRNVKDSGDCIEINGTFYALNKGRVVWDYKAKQYDLIGNLTEGIIDDKRTIGHFTTGSDSVTCVYANRLEVTCISEEVAQKANFAESFQDGKYYDLTAWQKSQLQQIARVDQNYKTRLDYNCSGQISKATVEWAKLYEITKEDDFIEYYYKKFSKIFDKYTFGIELETTTGLIPDNITKRLGLIPVRDGSIAGIEYVTIPLTGKKGLYTLKECMEQISKRTKTDYTCSMHIHVSGMKRDNETILSLFKFFFSIQESMYELFPIYKRKDVGIKRKNYTAPLSASVYADMHYRNKSETDTTDDMSKLIYYLTGKHDRFKTVKLEDVKNHPSDPSNSAKWNIVTRYVWMNLIPIIFTNKKTIEFRVFTMPDTFEKLFYMLLTSLSLLEFAEKNQKLILKMPEKLENLNVPSIIESVTGDRNLGFYLRDRMQRINQIQLNKGIMMEERDIKSPDIFSKTKGKILGNYGMYNDMADTMAAHTQSRRTGRATLQQAAERERILERLQETSPDVEIPGPALTWFNTVVDDMSGSAREGIVE